jgi:hypothetical protein
MNPTKPLLHAASLVSPTGAIELRSTLQFLHPADGAAFLASVLPSVVTSINGQRGNLAGFATETSVQEAIGAWMQTLPSPGELVDRITARTFTLRDSLGAGPNDFNLLCGDEAEGGSIIFRTMGNEATVSITSYLSVRGGFSVGDHTVTLNTMGETVLVLPSSGTLATLGDLTAAVQGLKYKASVRVATTTNGTLSTAFAAGQVVDGITLAAGNRILIKDQTSAAQNGIYLVTNGSPARAADFDTWAEIPGAIVAVELGTLNHDRVFLATSDQGGTLNTTAITFTELSLPSKLQSLAEIHPGVPYWNGSVWQNSSAAIGFGGLGERSLGDEVFLTDWLDADIGTAPSGLIVRDEASWIEFPPDVEGKKLTCHGPGNALTWEGAWKHKMTTDTALPGESLLLDSTDGPFTLNLPSDPYLGADVYVADCKGTWAINSITVSGNGSNIEGGTNVQLVGNSDAVRFIWNGEQWIMRG